MGYGNLRISFSKPWEGIPLSSRNILKNIFFFLAGVFTDTLDLLMIVMLKIAFLSDVTQICHVRCINNNAIPKLSKRVRQYIVVEQNSLDKK